jgi:hypothetical protein
MSKKNQEQEGKNQEPKNYKEFSYMGDEVITMTVGEFVAIQKALDQAIANGVIAQHPQVIRWYDAKTNKPVEKPTQKQIEKKEVVLLADSEATKSQENMQVSYKANLFPEVFNGREILMGIHERMVDEGVAKPIEELRKAYEERQAKGQMQVQEEAPKEKPSMKVVKDDKKSK